jgi:hypothetical protein
LVVALEPWLTLLLAPDDLLLLHPDSTSASVTPMVNAPLATRDLFAAFTEIPLVVWSDVAVAQKAYVDSHGFRSSRIPGIRGSAAFGSAVTA